MITWLKPSAKGLGQSPVIEGLIDELDTLARKLFEDVSIFRPFHYCERASVSQFVAAAARLNWFPIAEYKVQKRTWDAVNSGRTLPISELEPHETKSGYADFWCSTGSGDFLIEFKQTEAVVEQAISSEVVRRNIAKMHKHAIEEMRVTNEDEATERYSCLIAPVFDQAHIDAYHPELEIAKWAVKLTIGEPEDPAYSVFFYFTDREFSLGY